MWYEYVFVFDRGKFTMFIFKNCIFDIKNIGIILSESPEFMLSNDI